MTKSSEAVIRDVRTHAEELENSIKYRVSDCETLVKSRVTEEYVKNLGERIKAGIIDSVSKINKEKANIFLNFSSTAKTRTLLSVCTI